MADKYRICIVVPEGYKHSQAFVEVAMLLKLSLVDLGFECDVALNQLDETRTNVLLGYHLTGYSDMLSKVRYIPYQLEQLSLDQGNYSDECEEVLAKAIDVWDYSVENIAFLNSRGIQAKHLPVGYHSHLERIPHAKEKDIDVLFFGSGGERRVKILDALNAHPSVHLQTGFGVYAKQRDTLIGRSKIVLNIHAYDAKIFEAVRVSYLLNNRVCVISEGSPHYPYNGVPMCLVEYEQIVETCVKYVETVGLIEATARDAYEAFRQTYSMPELLKSVI